jgi:transcriptional regulator with XRE-family HTH domain
VAPLPGSVVGETRRQALGHFLRERREALAPEHVGISSHRGRRTPGLRREEVAFLADIGVKWYARLEAGDEVQPSAATLNGIASALRLSNAELEYMLGLAGLRHPLVDGERTTLAVPRSVAALLENVHGVSAAVCDRILTPLYWNRIADAIYGFSGFDSPVERNGLVRALFDADFIEFLGPEREELVFRAVGMFRLNYSSPSPSPVANEVYERVKGEALFEQAWNRRVIAAELTGEGVTVRYHPVVGRLDMYGVDFGISLTTDLFVRLMVPENEETAQKFAHLERVGHREAAETPLIRIG